jgi:hypothetical protein
VSLVAFYDEEVVQVGDVTLRLAMDFRAIDLMEHIVGDSDRITPATTIVEAFLFSSPVPVSISCKILYAMLRRHHEDVSLDEAMGAIAGEHSGRIALAMEALLKRSFNVGEPEKEKGENPPKRRGRSRSSAKSG